MKKLCEFCGADSPRNCDLREETNGVCPWEEMDDDPFGDEPDDDDERFGADYRTLSQDQISKS